MRSVPICNVELASDDCTLSVAFIDGTAVATALCPVADLVAKLMLALRRHEDASIVLDHNGESIRCVVDCLEVPTTLGDVEEAVQTLRARWAAASAHTANDGDTHA
jgi:hypothetical protein